MPNRTIYFTKENLALLVKEPNAGGLINDLLAKHYKRMAKVEKTTPA